MSARLARRNLPNIQRTSPQDELDQFLRERTVDAQLGLARKIDRLRADCVCVKHLDFVGVCRDGIRRVGARKLVKKVAGNEGRARSRQFDDPWVGGSVRDSAVVVMVCLDRAVRSLIRP